MMETDRGGGVSKDRIKVFLLPGDGDIIECSCYHDDPEAVLESLDFWFRDWEFDTPEEAASVREHIESAKQWLPTAEIGEVRDFGAFVICVEEMTREEYDALTEI
jgi:hypothetical protein